MGFTEKIAEEFAYLQDSYIASTVPALRKEAFDSVTKLGIPTTRHEEWKYTNIKQALNERVPMMPRPMQGIGGGPVNPKPIDLFEKIEGTKIVFGSGIFNSNKSTYKEQDNVIVTCLNAAFTSRKELIEKYYSKLINLNEEHFAALNTAFASDGAFIYVKKNVKVEYPIFIIHAYGSAEDFTQSRNLIIVEDGAEVNIIESFQNLGGDASYNHVSEIFVGANASVNLTKLQLEPNDTTGVNTLEAELQKDSRFKCTDITFGGKLMRNNVNARLKGENGDAHLYGLYYGKEKSVIDNHILIDHIVPHCESNQLYKGILDGESSGVFNGKIYVKKDAQKTNAFQSSKAILLSDEAAMNSKPQLEIFADDVKCSHGAAIGQLNENEIFYLEARGIPEKDAKSILTYAFANDVLNTVVIPELKEYLDNTLKANLNIDF